MDFCPKHFHSLVIPFPWRAESEWQCWDVLLSLERQSLELEGGWKELTQICSTCCSSWLKSWQRGNWNYLYVSRIKPKLFEGWWLEPQSGNCHISTSREIKVIIISQGISLNMASWKIIMVSSCLIHRKFEPIQFRLICEFVCYEFPQFLMVCPFEFLQKTF